VSVQWQFGQLKLPRWLPHRSQPFAFAFSGQRSGVSAGTTGGERGERVANTLSGSNDPQQWPIDCRNQGMRGVFPTFPTENAFPEAEWSQTK